MATQSIPIIEMKGCLLVSIQHELDDVEALQLQNDILNKLKVSGAGGLILDLSGVEVVDSFIARVFDDIARAAFALGAISFIAGFQPSVAMTLVDMGIELNHIKTVLTLDDALKILAGN